MVWTVFLFHLNADVIIEWSCVCLEPLWSQSGFVWCWCSVELFLVDRTPRPSCEYLPAPRCRGYFLLLTFCPLVPMGPSSLLLYPWHTLAHLFLLFFLLLLFFLFVLFLWLCSHTESLIVFITRPCHFLPFCPWLFLKTDSHYHSYVSGWKTQHHQVSPSSVPLWHFLSHTVIYLFPSLYYSLPSE